MSRSLILILQQNVMRFLYSMLDKSRPTISLVNNCGTDLELWTLSQSFQSLDIEHFAIVFIYQN
jgi:hypothetical protein